MYQYKPTSWNDNGSILPLVPIEDGDRKTENMVSHILRSIPGDADSPSYKIYVRILQGDEDCRSILKWAASVMTVCKGLNVTTHATALPIVETLMHGTPLSLFQGGLLICKRKTMAARHAAEPDVGAKAVILAAGIDHAGNLTFGQLIEAIGHVVTQLLPRRVLARVKRYMRRDCRKPRHMKVRTYVQHLLRMNRDELPSLPPFTPTQKMSDDELLDIILYGTPRSWHKEMERQGFDPMLGGVDDTLEMMERMEATDDFDGTPSKSPHQGKQSSNNSGKKHGKPKKGLSHTDEGKKGHCMIHGEGNHTSEECYTLQKEAKKLKSSYGSNTPKYADKAKSGSANKTWNRKAEQGKTKTKRDLAAFIGKEIAKGIKQSKDVASKKKRKSDNSDEEGEDLHVFDLEGFNYHDMDNIKIEDDDATSC